MSGVTCQVSHIRCHMSFFSFFFRQSSEASQLRVCYKQGLPRLVVKGPSEQQTDPVHSPNLTGSGNPTFESYVEGKALQRVEVYSWSSFQILYDCKNFYRCKADQNWFHVVVF